MSRGGRQKFGVDFIDQRAVRRAWGLLPTGRPVEVWVMMNDQHNRPASAGPG